MKGLKVLGLALTATVYSAVALAAGSPVGTWTTIDDKTGKPKALVKISNSGGTLSGSIVKIINPAPGDTPTMCNSCSGKFAKQSLVGKTILWGLKDDGNGVWSGGQIVDPKTGKVYRAKITTNGNTLSVRGYIGVSALGRTQTWTK